MEHDVYRQNDEITFEKVGVIHEKLNLQRVLTTTVAASVKLKSEAAEQEYRGHRSVFADMKGNPDAAVIPRNTTVTRAVRTHIHPTVALAPLQDSHSNV